MPLTPEEQAELEQLRAEASGSFGSLTPEEQAELEQLRMEAGTAPEAPQESVLQETHPEVGVGTRLLIKNLSNSPEVGMKYLQQKGFESKLIGDQIAVRKPGEKDWKALDPEGLDVGDIGDIGYDVGAGVVTGAASALGGLAGAPLGGVGALPAAAAAGAGTSAGLEGLRQKLGKWAGLPQEVDPTQVKVAGFTGALSPLLFGTGASAAQIGAKALQRGVGEEAVKQSQRGLLSRAVQAAPKIGEMFTGVPAQAIKTQAQKPQAVKKLAEEGAALEASQGLYSNIQNQMKSIQSTLGKELQSEVDSAGKMVNIANVRKHLDDYISELETGPLANNPRIKAQIDALKAERDDVFKTVKESVDDAGNSVRELVDLPNEIPASHAFQLQDLLKDVAELRGSSQNIMPSENLSSVVKKRWENSASGAYHELNKELNTATEGASQPLKQKLAKFFELKRELRPKFKDADTTFKTVSNLNSNAQKLTLTRLKQLNEMGAGNNVQEKASELFASRYFADPAWSELSGGTTGTARLLRGAGVGAGLGWLAGGRPGAIVGGLAGSVGTSPAALKYVHIPVAKGVGAVVNPLLNAAGTKPGQLTQQSIWNLLRTRTYGGQ